MIADTLERKTKWRARKTGRPRKPGERELGTGDLKRPERAADIVRVAMAQPHRAHLKPARTIRLDRKVPEEMRGADDLRELGDGCRGPKDQRAAYAFGRMRLEGRLTKAQHDALQHWLETFVRYTRSLGLPQMHYGNCLAASVGNSHDGDEPDPKSAANRAVKARRAFDALSEAINESLGTFTTEAHVALVHVCLKDADPLAGMEGNLRLAANAIDKHLTGHSRKAVDDRPVL